jgi:ABC-type dipeptide/oligopeptide/nickel transport system permease component
MSGYVAKRLLAVPPLLLGISLVVFSIIHLIPGDPVAAILGTSADDPALVKRLHEQLGLNLSLPAQYLHWLDGVVHWNFGYSYSQQAPVAHLISTDLLLTAELTGASLLFSLMLGTVIGTVAALRRNSMVDTASMGLALVFLSMPSFWLGLLVILLFAVHLHWLPVVGGLNFTGLLLPALTLGLGSMGFISRFVRSGVIEARRQQYVTVAKSRGLSTVRVIVRHVLRNAVLSVVTVAGLELGNLMSGAVIVETVFSRPGIGRLLVTAILSKDYPTLQAAALVIAVIYAGLNLLVDLLYPVLDPRLAHA